MRAAALAPARNPSAFAAMAAAILLIAGKIGGCAHRQPATSMPAEETAPDYVQASATGRMSLKLTVTAPEQHALYLENCNGAINWGLVEADQPEADPQWIVTRNQCLSPPVVVRAGQSQSFPLVIPQQDAAAPTQGAWRVLLMGVFKNWKGANPLRQPQVERGKLLSNPVTLGTIPAPA